MRRWAAATAVALIAVGPASAADQVPGPEHDYLLHCSGCHGADGSGAPGAVPSLHGLGPLLEIDGGRAYIVRVPGVAQAPLSDGRLARLLNWVLMKHSMTPASPPFTAAEVGPLRRRPLRDTVAARARLDALLEARRTAR